MIHPRPKTPPWEQVSNPGTLLFIILSLVCEPDKKEAYDTLSTSFFKKNIRGQKHPRKVNKYRNNISNIEHSRITLLTQTSNAGQPVYGKERPSYAHLASVKNKKNNTNPSVRHLENV